jgi:glutaredoxin 2
MTKTLKQIDKDILERIKKVHELVTRWSFMTKKEHDEGRLDDFHYEETATLRQQIEMEIRSIYSDVMQQEAIDEHIKKMNKEMEEEFG